MIEAFGQWNNINSANDAFLSETDTKYIVGPESCREPDAALIPINRPKPSWGQRANDDGARYPTLVVEVGLSERLRDLHNSVAAWLSGRTTVRACIIFKLWERRMDNTVAMLAMVYLRSIMQIHWFPR